MPADITQCGELAGMHQSLAPRAVGRHRPFQLSCARSAAWPASLRRTARWRCQSVTTASRATAIAGLAVIAA
jgi:hypothetical protein